jgi:hypothetical protein
VCFQIRWFSARAHDQVVPAEAMSDQIRGPLADGRQRSRVANSFHHFSSSPGVIRLVAVMNVRLPLSPRNIHDLVAVRGIDVSSNSCSSIGISINLKDPKPALAVQAGVPVALPQMWMAWPSPRSADS